MSGSASGHTAAAAAGGAVSPIHVRLLRPVRRCRSKLMFVLSRWTGLQTVEEGGPAPGGSPVAVVGPPAPPMTSDMRSFSYNVGGATCAALAERAEGAGSRLLL